MKRVFRCRAFGAVLGAAAHLVAKIRPSTLQDSLDGLRRSFATKPQGGFVSLPRSLLIFSAIATLITARPAGLRAEPDAGWLERYREPAARLIGEATSESFAWRRLAAFTDA